MAQRVWHTTVSRGKRGDANWIWVVLAIDLKWSRALEGGRRSESIAGHVTDADARAFFSQTTHDEFGLFLSGLAKNEPGSIFVHGWTWEIREVILDGGADATAASIFGDADATASAST